MKQHYEAMRQLSRLSGIEEKEWLPFVEKTVVRHIPLGQQIITAGDEVRFAYFCVSGLFRLYYLLEDGKEHTAGFTLEGDYATSYAAMVNGQRSPFTIEAMEDSIVIEISHDLLKQLMKQYHSWERFIRISVERLYSRKEERERELLYLSARERYNACLRKYPGLDLRVPQYHIASYIGVSPVSLSRLLHQDETK